MVWEHSRSVTIYSPRNALSIREITRASCMCNASRLDAELKIVPPRLYNLVDRSPLSRVSANTTCIVIHKREERNRETIPMDGTLSCLAILSVPP